MNIIAFEGKEPRIHPRAKIFQNACIIGDVEIGEDSSVWFNSVIRGDLGNVRIGARVNIQDLVIIHAHCTNVDNKIVCNGDVIIDDDVSINHGVVLHSCKINQGCFVGLNSVISDSVEVGELCLIMPNSFLPKGRKYPPYSLISGNPAKVVRPLQDKEISMIKNETLIYKELKNRYN